LLKAILFVQQTLHSLIFVLFSTPTVNTFLVEPGLAVEQWESTTISRVWVLGFTDNTNVIYNPRVRHSPARDWDRDQTNSVDFVEKKAVVLR